MTSEVNGTPSGYEAPTVTVVGTLHELTQKQHKYVSKTSDYIYPDSLSFNLSA